ncbi:MAG: propionyl-CoA synthetase, partial [Gammaproteobacteria bacterium]|nr:propionyl-CoA synthetase [Gammaproteobacteria bacterium]
MPSNAYRDAQRRAREDPEGFWAEQAAALHWERRWDSVLDAERAPFYRWFRGGRINTCYNALDRHIEQGRGAQAALIYDSPVTGSIERLSYAELR